MKTVADTLGVSRSNLHRRVTEAPRARESYRKAGDAELLASIRAITDARPTYGYRRVCALINRERAALGRPPCNHKRIYRVMKQAGLLLQRHTGRPRGRTHDGKIAVMTSNRRWCSDALEFSCWNGDVVRVVFVLDAHDREVIAWQAVVGCGIGGDHVRDMMLAAVERRFGRLRAPVPVEWLSDNGSPYTAKPTLDMAAALNLVPCFTPVASPESNGMAEAFVKTFKRDYVRVNPIPDAHSALRQLTGWFEDYNENHPHSGLKMRSPRAFFRAQNQPAACPI